MANGDERYIGHMHDAAARIQQFVVGKSRAEFDADEMLQLAVIHLIQTIGEAARLVSDDFQRLHPEIPWPQIVGMRHRIVHDYLNVDYDIVWQVLAHDLQPLIDGLAPLVPPKP